MKRKAINKGCAHIMTAQQMRAADRASIENAKIPGIVLMENAALACVSNIASEFDIKRTSFAVFCGKGNNGGDGLAIARHLFNKGAEVYVYLTSGNGFSGDALINYEALRAIGATVIGIDNTSLIRNFVKSADVVIDAMLGTGISGGASGMIKNVIEEINKAARYVLSVDIPSGANADTGGVETVCVKADMTVTFAAYKRAMFLYPAADYCGRVVLADISIPAYITDVKGQNVYASCREGVEEAFPKRYNNSHKGDYGKIMMIGGSVGMAGAVAMSAKAAQKCGAGLVTVAVPVSINNIIQTKIDEVMTIPLPEEGGRISKAVAERLARRANACDAVLIGPGLGRSENITEFVSEFLPMLTVPTVVDADAIFALSKNIRVLDRCNNELILTPHSAELGYLLSEKAEEIERDRFRAAYEFATEYKVTLILKGHHTIITAPDGDMSVNTTGNSGMACAGSGDALAGMCTALLARGLNAYEAAVSAAYLHGEAGDKAAEKLGKDSMCATDIINNIYRILPVEN